MPKTRESLSLAMRFYVLRRDNYTCQYCGAKAPDTALHVDHVTPASKGGGNEPDNLIAACIRCNLGKSDRQNFADTRPYSERERRLANHSDWWRRSNDQMSWAFDLSLHDPCLKALLFGFVRSADPFGTAVVIADDFSAKVSLSREETDALVRGLEATGYMTPVEGPIASRQEDIDFFAVALNYHERKDDEHIRQHILADFGWSTHFSPVERIHG